MRRTTVLPVAGILAALIVAANGQQQAPPQAPPQGREGDNVTRGLDAAQRGQTASARGKWEPSKAFPMPMEEPVGVTVNGRFYVIQGLTDGGFQPMGVVYVYDPAADEWTKKNPMPMALHHAMTTVLNGKIY